MYHTCSIAFECEPHKKRLFQVLGINVHVYICSYSTCMCIWWPSSLEGTFDIQVHVHILYMYMYTYCTCACMCFSLLARVQCMYIYMYVYD